MDLIVHIRKENPAWSKHKIAVILSRDHGVTLSASTVGRILKRKGLYDSRKSRKKQRAAEKRMKKVRAARWMRDAFPGSLVQVDTKHLSFFGRKYYQFTAIDCFSRLSFCRVFGTMTSANAARFLSEMLEYFPFTVLAVQTDNGSEYMKDFDSSLSAMGITHCFSHPNCPKENSRVERKIQTTKYELWSYRSGCDVEDCNAIAGEWNNTYNNVRPHQALGYKTPSEFLKSWYDSSKCRGEVSTM